MKGVVEEALAEAIERARRERLKGAINALLVEMKEIPEGQWVRVVKGCRRER